MRVLYHVGLSRCCGQTDRCIATTSSKRLIQCRSDLTAVDKMLKKEITETKNQPHLRDLALFFDVLAKSIEHYRSTHLQSIKPVRPALNRSVSGEMGPF